MFKAFAFVYFWIIVMLFSLMVRDFISPPVGFGAIVSGVITSYIGFGVARLMLTKASEVKLLNTQKNNEVLAGLMVARIIGAVLLYGMLHLTRYIAS